MQVGHPVCNAPHYADLLSSVKARRVDALLQRLAQQLCDKHEAWFVVIIVQDSAVQCEDIAVMVPIKKDNALMNSLLELQSQ